MGRLFNTALLRNLIYLRDSKSHGARAITACWRIRKNQLRLRRCLVSCKLEIYIYAVSRFQQLAEDEALNFELGKWAQQVVLSVKWD